CLTTLIMEDIFGFGKVLPIDKLLDLVAKSVGKLSKSYFDRKDIDTKGYEIEVLAKARAKELQIISLAVKNNSKLTGGIEYKDEKFAVSSPNESGNNGDDLSLKHLSIEERATDRIAYQNAKQQLNIESVTAYAAEQLQDEPPVTDENPEEDWAARFFKIVEDISNEEMQALWGKILAGEIKQPKTYSLRTLELIRNLSKHEADVFTKIANFALKAGENNYIFASDRTKVLEKHNVGYGDIALLTEIGLLQPGAFVHFQIQPQPSNAQQIFASGKIIIFVNVKANTPIVRIPVHVFSNAGNELLKLIDVTANMEYLKAFADEVKSDQVEVKYSYITGYEDKVIHYRNPILDFTN
ncbi:MAG: DUF2806 domain-containing protein, partial [Daejeonella sp.]|uniref:DUF2806 domain-containing protein n=1 Tax=Daejeonella sp. TaxID=2805397 RepID=UPI003C72AF4F